MALVSSDERDLLIPLAEGIHETPLWQTFLRRLLDRTKADQIHLLLRPADPLARLPARRSTSRDWTREVPDFDLDALESAGLFQTTSWRPGRVYALEEMLAVDAPDRLKQQRAILDAHRIGHCRAVRIALHDDHGAALIVQRERADFAAMDSAILSSLAPHIAAALRTLIHLRGLEVQAAVALEPLQMQGIGQLILDGGGTVLAADATAVQALADHGAAAALPGRRLPLPPGASQALQAACARLACGPGQERALVHVDGPAPFDLLLRQFSGHDAPGALVVAAIRSGLREPTASAIRTLAAVHGLSDREAALAHALSQGQSIVDAGARLHLTRETARNYSKRIYAKTGATGQADLVRIILTGLAPLA